MRPALMTIGFAALVLLSACAGGTTSAPYPGDTLRQAQDTCDSGDGAACNVANRLRAEQYRRL